jgi:hypothetical protein
MENRVFIPLAALVLGSAYLITVWTDGVATGVGFFAVIAVFMAVYFLLQRRDRR